MVLSIKVLGPYNRFTTRLKSVKRVIFTAVTSEFQDIEEHWELKTLRKELTFETVILFLIFLHFYRGPADYAYNGHKYTKLLD